jgi:hypothetical protein
MPSASSTSWSVRPTEAIRAGALSTVTGPNLSVTFWATADGAPGECAQGEWGGTAAPRSRSTAAASRTVVRTR